MNRTSAVLLASIALFAACRAPAGKSLRPKVLMIGLDGCRPDALVVAETPAIDGLLREGTISLEAQTCAVTSSGPSWSSLLTGVWPAKHGVLDNSFEGSRFDEYPHVFVRLKELRPAAFTASVAHWSPIDEFVVSAADVSTGTETAQEATDRAVELLARDELDFLFVHLDDIDHAGHASGYSKSNPEYVAAIEESDRLIGRMVRAMKARARHGEEDWLVLITTDHGGSGTSHGQDVPEHRTIFLLLAGPSVSVGRIARPAEIVDAAATALHHLGVPLLAEWELDGEVVGLR